MMKISSSAPAICSPKNGAWKVSPLARTASLCFCAGLFALSGAARAEQFTYTNGENQANEIELTEDAELFIASGTATQSGEIDDDDSDNPFGVTKTGDGTLILSAENGYEGGTTVEAGILRMGTDYGLAGDAPVIINGGTLDINGYALYTGSLTGSGALALGSGFISVETTGTDTFSGAITGDGNSSFYKNGAGTLTLSGNSNLGYLSITDGKLISTGLNSSFGAFSQTAGEFSLEEGRLTVASTMYIDSTSSIAFGVTNGSVLDNSTGSVYITAYDNFATALVSGTGSQWLTGYMDVGSSGTGVLTISDGGEVGIYNPDDKSGTLDLGNGSSGDSGTLNIGAASGEAPAAPGILDADFVDAEKANRGTVVFNHTSTGYYFTKDGTALGGAVQITGRNKVVQENGVTFLTGTNDYSGGTQINGGRLVMSDMGSSDSAVGTGAVAVGENGAFAGAGTVLGATTVAGLLAPGDFTTAGTGQITFKKGLTLESTAILQMDLASATDFDRLSIANAFTYGGILRLSLLDGFTPEDGDTFTLFLSSSHTGAFSSILFDAGSPGYTATLDYATGVLTLHAVPEPSSLLLVGLGGGLALCWMGRRRVKGS